MTDETADIKLIHKPSFSGYFPRAMSSRRRLSSSQPNSASSTEESESTQGGRRSLVEMQIQLPNNDTTVEILSWLPAETLLRFETVSKWWHKIISENSFQRVQCQKVKSKISGFFFQNVLDWSKQVDYIPLNSTSAVLHPQVLNFLAAKVKIAASSNGLLCCHTVECLHPTRPNQDKFMYVCNPATKKFVQIEWPKSRNSSLVFGLISDTLCTNVDDLPKFKLVSVSKEDMSNFLVQVYSSKTTEWRMLKKCKYSGDLGWCGGRPCGQVVFASGVLYWIIDASAILAFHVEMEQSYFISFPVPWEREPHRGIHENCIGESQGQLHYILISDVGIGLWCLSSESKWEVRHFMYLSAMQEEFPHFLYNEAKEAAGLVPSDFLAPKWIEPLFLQGDILLLKLHCSFSSENEKIEKCTKIYKYNLSTKMLEQMCTFDSGDFFLKVFPYSMTLIPFPGLT